MVRKYTILYTRYMYTFVYSGRIEVFVMLGGRKNAAITNKKRISRAGRNRTHISPFNGRVLPC